MPTRYTVVCDDNIARRVSRLAREHDLTEEEVLRQLVEVGLENVSA
jgi:predicted transcriptional regulator